MSDKGKLKGILKYFWLVYAVGSIFFVLYLVDTVVCNELNKVSKKIILEDNWKITINEKVYENINLEDFIFDSVNRNDIVIMETRIPDDFEYRDGVICIQNAHTTLAMYVDDELVYEYGQDRYKDGKATGSGELYIDFYEEYKGKNLRLEYIAVENSAFSRLSSPWINRWENTYRYIATENRLPLLIGSFLVIFGVMMVLIQVFAITISTKYLDILYLSLFSLCMGLWTLCYYDIMMIFAIPLYKISLIEYMSLFIAPVPIIAYMNTHVKGIKNKKISLIYKILFVTQMVLTVAAVMFHLTNKVHSAAMLKYFLFLYIIHLSFFAYVIYRRVRYNKAMSKYTNLGIFTVMFCIFYEIATYLFERLLGYQIPKIKGVSSVGFTVFIGILIIDLYQRTTKNMMEEQEREFLIKRAYIDELTQIYNRAFCSEYMEKLYECVGYTIINFDLNGLKKMNDTYGHTKGDELICQAAMVLEKSFTTDGVVGRMGGDEFIAIIETDETDFIEGLIDKFNFNIQEANREKPELGLSISYGYATNNDVEDASPEKVYHIADERMYAYKQKVKKAMQA